MLTTWDDEFIICVLVKPHMNDFYVFFFYFIFFLYTVIYVFYFWKILLYVNNKDK